MIGFLNGKIDLLQRPNVIIDVNGVGYKVLVSENVYKNLTVGQKIKIFTYTYVRDDALELFGFLEIDDLKLFESLLTVSGIGPRTALNIFSFGERQNIIEAIVKGDSLFFTSVPRLGTKNAQRIIIELKNKMGGDGLVDLSGKDLIENTEAIEALKNFGFSVVEAQKALRNLESGLSTEEKIKQALKSLGR
ncbi:MAG: Holliday junction DNA helicase RuvA [Candidatus Levybacteria bacterium RIFCSPHIGHO2_01_FULL_37_17]|nr:MAG: Holliday junction DNA helicase RuvA [Candidatus Levybacteria bacterium RIFCSPHIGHO2_01_FULL_37_17]OGH36421.1 MAG: Holliday junction DNA helicase RuvA [Candidatus Levybacteria bacterium RIFCSPLOWO2_01_FULL_38_23]